MSDEDAERHQQENSNAQGKEFATSTVLHKMNPLPAWMGEIVQRQTQEVDSGSTQRRIPSIPA